MSDVIPTTTSLQEQQQQQPDAMKVGHESSSNTTKQVSADDNNKTTDSNHKKVAQKDVKDQVDGPSGQQQPQQQQQQQQQRQQREEEKEQPKPPVTATISKNQLKRQQKWERKMEVKRKKKEHIRNTKIAKAKAEGRDIVAEQQDMEKRRLEGVGWKKRNDKWKTKFQKQQSKFEICIDCSYENQMTIKEITSLSSQIRYCYSTNKKVKHPVRVTVTSLGERQETLSQIQRVAGHEQWIHREFYCTDKDILDVYPDKSKLIYLTSDSNNVLQTLEDDKVYIIGGIVDRNRLKGVANERAKTLGIETAKLPITEYLKLGSATRVLTCNHVFDILVKWRENDNDWKRTLLNVLPDRKDAT